MTGGKILITGSAEGLGSMAAQALASRGHAVYLHARNASRAEDARRACPSCHDVLVGDLSSLDETKQLASQINSHGPWEAIVHNAGVMRADRADIFAVNTLAPWTLTCLIDPPPSRYVFLSSDSHYGGTARDIRGLEQKQACGYGDSKLHNVMLANWFSRHFAAKGQNVPCNSMDPGWVATKMGGRMAPGDPKKAVGTYVLLSESGGGKTGKYWLSSREDTPQSEGTDEGKQNLLAEVLAKVSGVSPK